MATTNQSLLLLLARMREAGVLLARAEDLVSGAGEYLETDDCEILCGLASRGVDRIVSRLEQATGVVEVGEGVDLVQLDASDLCEGMPTMLKAMAADENADLRRARVGLDQADFEARR